MAVCDKHCVQYMVLSKQLPKSVKDKKKCILVILFAKSFTFSSSWYCPINYPNQRRMKNKHLILAILFTKSCNFSKSLFPVHSTFKPITQISAEWKKIILFWPFYLHTTALIHWLCVKSSLFPGQSSFYIKGLWIKCSNVRFLQSFVSLKWIYLIG